MLWSRLSPFFPVSPSLFTRVFKIVTRTPAMIGITVFLIFHDLKTNSGKIQIFLEVFLFSFKLWSCKLYLLTYSFPLLASISWSILISKPQKIFGTYVRGQFLMSALCDAKLTIIPKRDFIFARGKTGQVGTWSLTEISPVQSFSLRHVRTGILREGII